MEQITDKMLITDMNRFLSEAEKINASAGNSADNEDALPFETLDCFSTDPVGFSEMSVKLMNKVDYVFDQAVRFNRHSSSYLRSCAQLEKGIKYLGSLCITKVALGRKNHLFPELGQLSTEKLYGMASFHFRKLDAALSEHNLQKNEISSALMEMFYRYFQLLQRLRSTETKIYNFNLNSTYKAENYSPLMHGLAFSNKSWTRDIHKKYSEHPAFRQAPAFSTARILDPEIDIPAVSQDSRQLPAGIIQRSSASASAEPEAGAAVNEIDSAGASPEAHPVTPDETDLSLVGSSDEAVVQKTENSSCAPVQGSDIFSEAAEADLYDESLRIPGEPEPVDYEAVLKLAAERGIKRAEATGEKEPVLCFSEDELRQLALDEGFLNAYPDLYPYVFSAFAENLGPPESYK